MARWGYGAEDGPHTWHTSFPSAGGCRQSPMNIELDKLKYDLTLNIRPLTVSFEAERQLSQTLVYTGHNFRIDVAGGSCVSGGPVPTGQTCILSHFNFHWGSTDYSGSEHLINGHQFPAELHFVCYNASKYRCFEEAMGQPDGLLIIAVLMHVGSKNPTIERLSGPLTSIQFFRQHDFRQETNLLDLTAILPHNICRYYTYPGSLTTPPCYESVTWLIFEETVGIDSDQLSQFRKIHMGDSCCGPDNFRPICPIGERIVCKNFP